MLKLAPALALALAACGQPPSSGPTTPAPNPEPTAVEPDPTPDPVSGTCTAEEGGDSFGAMKNEVIGGVKLGLAEAAVKELLGEPGEVSGPVDNAAVGSFGWTWSYPDKGLEIEMSAEKKTDPKSLSAITVSSRAAVKTRFGVGIGATTADVERAYGPCISKEGGEETIVAGTIYGGVMFSIEDGKVVGIFVGAAAE